MRRRGVGLLAGLALVCALLPVAVATPPAAATAAGRYVALGDSYAAGLGITPAATDGPASGCGQSTRNYPRQVASALGLDLVDVTCSGAVTADMAGSQQTGGATVPPQLDALTADTTLVTLTIGGNDLGFSSVAGYCASLVGPDGPVLGGGQDLATCEQHYVTGGDDTLRSKLTDTVAPAIAAVFGAIRARAPRAKIVVVDYPAIVPDAANTPSGGCWANPLQSSDALPFTTVDLPYLQQLQARLDNALAGAATAAGAAVAQVYPASLAHTACGQDPWVNGVQVSGLAVGPSSLHPNLAGATQMADAATSVARTVLAGGTVAAPAALTTSSSAGLPGWAWAAIVVGALVVLIVVVGVFRVRRRLSPR